MGWYVPNVTSILQEGEIVWGEWVQRSTQEWTKQRKEKGKGQNGKGKYILNNKDGHVHRWCVGGKVWLSTIILFFFYCKKKFLCWWGYFCPDGKCGHACSGGFFFSYDGEDWCAYSPQFFYLQMKRTERVVITLYFINFINLHTFRHIFFGE